MSVFKQRKQSVEAKFARDGELAFQARIHAFRCLAGWAAELKGDTPVGEQDLARDLIREALRFPGDDNAIAVAAKYLGYRADEALLRAKLIELQRDATAILGQAKAS